MVWCEIGLVDTDLYQWEWLASINCRYPEVCLCDDKPSVCYAWVDHKDSHCPRCKFRESLKELQKETRDLKYPSPSLLVQSLANFEGSRNEFQPYISHQSIERARWILPKNSSPASAGDPAAARWEELREKCMPTTGGDVTTAVVVPLTLRIDHQTRHAGGLIVCGRVDSDLWLYLPQAKAAVLSLLEQWRHHIAAVVSSTDNAGERLVKAFLAGGCKADRPFLGGCRNPTSKAHCRKKPGKDDRHYCDCFYVVRPGTQEYFEPINDPDFEKALLCIPDRWHELMHAQQSHEFETAHLRSLLQRILGFGNITTSGKSSMYWPVYPGLSALLGLLKIYDALSQESTEEDVSLEEISIEASQIGATVWFVLRGDDAAHAIRGMAAARLGSKRFGGFAGKMAHLAMAKVDLPMSDRSEFDDGQNEVFRAYFAGTDHPEWTDGTTGTVHDPGPGHPVITPVFSPKDKAIGFTWRYQGLSPTRRRIIDPEPDSHIRIRVRTYNHAPERLDMFFSNVRHAAEMDSALEVDSKDIPKNTHPLTKEGIVEDGDIVFVHGKPFSTDLTLPRSIVVLVSSRNIGVQYDSYMAGEAACISIGKAASALPPTAVQRLVSVLVHDLRQSRPDDSDAYLRSLDEKVATAVQ